MKLLRSVCVSGRRVCVCVSVCVCTRDVYITFYGTIWIKWNTSQSVGFRLRIFVLIGPINHGYYVFLAKISVLVASPESLRCVVFLTSVQKMPLLNLIDIVTDLINRQN